MHKVITLSNTNSIIGSEGKQMKQKHEEEVVYAVQEYLVKFDLGNPVEIRIGVYHENQTELTRDEIIEEALGYAHEVKLPLDESAIYEIETVKKE